MPATATGRGAQVVLTEAQRQVARGIYAATFALGLVLLPSLAWGQAATYADRSGTITSGGVAQTLAPVSPNRRGCMIQNQSAGDLWVSSTAAAAATQPAIRIPSGAQYLCMSPAESGALSIFGATTAQAFAAREW